MDAYVAPVVRRYLSTLIAELDRGYGVRQLHIMESNGGAMTAEAARQKPVQTLLSGPVGGAIGAAEVARTLERPNLICVDMGGTSFDASLFVVGEPSASSEAEIEGLPIHRPRHRQSRHRHVARQALRSPPTRWAQSISCDWSGVGRLLYGVVMPTPRWRIGELIGRAGAGARAPARDIDWSGEPVRPAFPRHPSR